MTEPPGMPPYPVRQERAAKRAREHRAEVEYREAQLELAKMKLQSVIDVWDLDPVTLRPN